MRRILDVLVVASLLAVGHAAPADAYTTVGTNLGLTYFSPSGGGDGITTVAAPGGPILFSPLSVPGMRLGFGAPSGDEGYVDVSLMYASAQGTTLTAFAMSLNYQHAFQPAADASPYVTVGFGVFHAGIEDETTTNPLLGGGIGFRSRIAGGHGAVRTEARFDHYFDDSSGNDGGTAISAKFGVDLLIGAP